METRKKCDKCDQLATRYELKNALCGDCFDELVNEATQENIRIEQEGQIRLLQEEWRPGRCVK